MKQMLLRNNKLSVVDLTSIEVDFYTISNVLKVDEQKKPLSRHDTRRGADKLNNPKARCDGVLAANAAYNRQSCIIAVEQLLLLAQYLAQ